MMTLSFLLGLICALLPQRAQAALSVSDLQGIVNSVGNVLPDWGGSSGGATAANSLIIQVVQQARPYLFLVAILMIMYAGFRMVIGQDDNAKETAKHILNMSLAGIILAFMLEPFINAFYGTGGEVFQSNPTAGVMVLSTEVLAIIEWSLFLVAILAVLMIIVTGLKAVFAAGSEQGITELRNTIFSIAAGIVLILMRYILAIAFGTYGGGPNVNVLVTAIVNIATYVLGFVTLAAVVVVIYAGIQYLTSFGSEEQAGKAKGLLIRASIGLAVVFMSYMIVRFVMTVMAA